MAGFPKIFGPKYKRERPKMKDANKNIESAAEHDEVDLGSSEPTSLYTLVETINVTVSVPQFLEIKLVDSSVLKEYEIWSIQSSALFSIVIGIAVAIIQSCDWSSPLVIFGLIFFVWLLISLKIAYGRRKQLERNAKSIPFVSK